MPVEIDLILHGSINYSRMGIQLTDILRPPGTRRIALLPIDLRIRRRELVPAETLVLLHRGDLPALLLAHPETVGLGLVRVAALAGEAAGAVVAACLLGVGGGDGDEGRGEREEGGEEGVGGCHDVGRWKVPRGTTGRGGGGKRQVVIMLSCNE